MTDHAHNERSAVNLVRRATTKSFSWFGYCFVFIIIFNLLHSENMKFLLLSVHFPDCNFHHQCATVLPSLLLGGGSARRYVAFLCESIPGFSPFVEQNSHTMGEHMTYGSVHFSPAPSVCCGGVFRKRVSWLCDG